MKKSYLPLCFVFALLGYTMMQLNHVTVPMQAIPLETLTDSLDFVELGCEELHRVFGNAAL